MHSCGFKLSVLVTPQTVLITLPSHEGSDLQFHLLTGHCLYDISDILQDQYVIAKLHEKARLLVSSSNQVKYARCSKCGAYKRKQNHDTTAKNIDVTANESSK